MRVRVTPAGENRIYTARFMVSALDCPHLQTPAMKGYHAALVFEHGAASGLVRSMIYGEFKTNADDLRVFFDHDMEAVRRCMARNEDDARRGKMRAGIDLSTTIDGDPKIIYVADGTLVLPAFCLRIEDTMDAGDEIVKILRDANVDPRDAVFDAGGSGKPIVDYIENRLGYRPVVRYMVSQAPRWREEYFDRATEDTWRMKRIFHTQPVKLPNDKELYEQMRTRCIRQMEHDKIKLEPKPEHRKKHRESPDRLDALMMLFSLFSETSTARPATQSQERDAEEDYKKRLAKSKHYPDLHKDKARAVAFGGMVKQPDLRTIRQPYRTVTK